MAVIIRHSATLHRSHLDWVFTIQTERVIAKDNTVAISARSWQIDKTRFRHTLAGTTVTVHEHLDGAVSVRYGPHVVGRFHSDGSRRKNAPPERRGKGGSMEVGENQKQVSSGSHTPLESRQPREIPTFPPRRLLLVAVNKRPGRLAPPKPETGQITY